MHNETAVKLLVCYITRLAFTVLCLATGAPHCKSDTSERLKKLTLLKLGVFFFALKHCDCYICQVLSWWRSSRFVRAMMCLFRMILSVQSDRLPKEHYRVGICRVDALCIWGANRVLTHYVEEFLTTKGGVTLLWLSVDFVGLTYRNKGVTRRCNHQSTVLRLLFYAVRHSRFIQAFEKALCTVGCCCGLYM